MSRRLLKNPPKNPVLASDVYDDNNEAQDLAAPERQLEFDYNNTPEGSNLQTLYEQV